MAAVTPPRTQPDDRLPMLASVLGFSLALGAGTVAIPLVALAAGYDPATIGFLAAVAATKTPSVPAATT